MLALHTYVPSSPRATCSRISWSPRTTCRRSRRVSECAAQVTAACSAPATRQVTVSCAPSRTTRRPRGSRLTLGGSWSRLMVAVRDSVPAMLVAVQV